MNPLSPSAPKASGEFAPRSLTLAVLCLAVLIVQIDMAVVNLATRSIGASFGAGVAALQWVVDGYNLVYAVFLLTGGLLADLYGRRRVFMIGAAAFTAGSLLCGFAPSIAVLIAGRAVAGLGAALLMPATLAIIRVIWHDPVERGRALGIWAACNGAAMVIGATLGGLLIASFSWRSVFLVVVPLGLAALVLAVPAIPESADPRGRRFDLGAQALGALALGGLAMAAIEAHRRPGAAAAALAAALLALVLFIRVEQSRGDAALVPLDLFRVPAFLGAVIATTGMTFGMYGAIFLLPLTWQATGRLDATQAGLALVPMALVFLLVSPVSGRFEQRAGRRAATAGGVAVTALGLLTVAAGSAGNAGLWPDEIGLMLTGLGMGLATGPLMGAAVGAVAPARAGTPSALINVARIAGATIGVAALGALYAFVGGGPTGLCIAMLVGGFVQLATAAAAWRLTASVR